MPNNDRCIAASIASLFILFAVTGAGHADGIAASSQTDVISPTQSIEESRARRAEADRNFKNIIQVQNEDFYAPGRNNSPLSALESLSLGESEQEHSSRTSSTPVAGAPAQVEIPIDEYNALRAELEAQRNRARLSKGPNVILGASSYTGKAVSGALEMTLKLQVTLGKNDRWKIVPLIGTDVVIIDAAVDGRPIALSQQNGYVVWPTERSGEITVTVRFLAPSRGPRGSLEYDFFAPRTPVTQFQCTFPGVDLDPRLASAQHAEITDDGTNSLLTATLAPTTRIHLVGFKDIGNDAETAARVFAESMSLFSIDESDFELFSVFRYTILYAGTKSFDIEIPKDMTVVSADGEGAFRYNLEQSETGQILRGETAFPIRNNYEISIRLKKKNPDLKGSFVIPLPKAKNVERETGWLAVEVPGKLRIEESTSADAVQLDVRQLPEEMITSAVSPIIKAYRFHSNRAAVALTAARLPEKELASGSVDRIRAFSVVSPDGKLLTDMKIRLRNRLRPDLALNLSKDVTVRSVHLDGEAVRPSRDKNGALILPLKRSGGEDQLQPFTVQVVLESRIPSLGVWGESRLQLPAVELPASSVAWSVYLPANNRYSRLREPHMEPQGTAREAQWHRPLGSTGAIRTSAAQTDAFVNPQQTDDRSAGGGVMAVRIDLPESGVRLDYNRYWLEAGAPLTLSFRYIRGWLMLPAGLLSVLASAFGLLLLFSGILASKRSVFIPGIVISAACLLPTWKLAHAAGIIFSALLAVSVLIIKQNGFARAKSAVTNWWSSLGERFRNRDKADTRWSVSRILCAAAISFTSIILFVVGIRFILLFFRSL